MDNFIGFKCVGEDRDPVPDSLLESINISYVDAFTKSESMAEVSKKIKEVKNDVFCVLPFSVTIEAEALGAELSIDDKLPTPITKEGTFKNLDEINSRSFVFSVNDGRIKSILDAVEILTKSGEQVILNVEGPLTILSMLINTRTVYKEIIKNPESILIACDNIIDYLCEYIYEGIRSGAKIISYSDPFAAYELVSKDVYKNICGEVTYRLLKKLEGKINGCIIHLCGRTSIGFEKSGFCKGEKVKVENNVTYGDALNAAISNREVKIVGHRCMKEVNKAINDQYYWNIKLCENM